MSEIKVSVSIILQGGVMLTQAEAEQLEKNKVGTGYDLTRIRADGKKNSAINVRTRKSRPATQTMSMCKEAYDYMTGKDSCPPNINQFVWTKMKPAQRFEAHLDLVCKYLKGTSYTYKVFDD